MEKTVLVVIPAEERHKEKLERAGKGCRFVYASPQTATEEMIEAADVIIGNVKPDRLHAPERLQWLQLNSAGADAYVKPGILRNTTMLTSATGAYGKAVAEHSFAMLLMLQKKLNLYRDAQKKNEWSDFGTVTSITDSIVLVVGLGDIGLHFARLASVLGAHVIGLKRSMGPCPEGVHELHTMDELDNLLPKADVVASFVPSTATTYHMYTKERLMTMKDTAIFLNSGRGDAVASEVLYEALSKGWIASAGIDVTEPEPLPADSPLWQLPNLMMTPHISGQFHLPETFERIVDIAAANLEAYLKGEPIKNRIQ